MTDDNRGYHGPLPSPDFRKQVANEVMPPFVGSISGEVDATVTGVLGVARFAGRVSEVIVSVAGSGKNDTQVPSVEVDVLINDTSIFTTKPKIVHVSGETAQHKTTWSEASDTGITEAVIDGDANSFSIGDIISWSVAYSGTASPTTKVRNPSIVVEVEPKYA